MSIKASRILGIGLALAAVGALAACSDDSTGDNNTPKGGSASVGGGGAGGSSAGSTTTGGQTTGGQTTGGQTTGGQTAGGSGGAGGGTSGACKGTKPTNQLITSFEDATAAGKFNIAIPGGTFTYPMANLTVDAATGKSLNVKGTVKDYSGFGIYFNDCHDAAGAGATGISFNIKGNVGTGAMLSLRVQSNANTKYTVEGMKGLCPMAATYEECHDAQFDIPVTAAGADVMVTWDKFTGGVPKATIDGKDVVGIEWAFKWDTGDTEYTVDVTVDDIKWLGTIAGGGGAGGGGNGGTGGT